MEVRELDKLEAYLKEHGYDYDRIDNRHGWDDFHQIIVYHKLDDGERIRQWDAICHPYSYGGPEGLLEIYGSIVDEEKYEDSVVGWLTAEDIIRIIEEDQE